MPDDNDLILKAIYDKLIAIELKLDAIKASAFGTGSIIDKESPFFNPDKGVYDVNYYRENNPDVQKKGGVKHEG
jgi:hypothetical protein